MSSYFSKIFENIYWVFYGAGDFESCPEAIGDLICSSSLELSIEWSLFFLIFDVLCNNSGDLVAVEGVHVEIFDASVLEFSSYFPLTSSSEWTVTYYSPWFLFFSSFYIYNYIYFYKMIYFIYL